MSLVSLILCFRIPNIFNLTFSMAQYNKGKNIHGVLMYNIGFKSRCTLSRQFNTFISVVVICKTVRNS